jgi:selenocysteine-specific translation elongation factor
LHVVATAGHVDHGKSTLVRALTGMEPDRWAEERRRGMTIDLGYAWTALPGGDVLAFVDVPGHQRFLGNMLAGLGPAPAVMVVVAADEGWRRQSGEHLAAVDALGLTHGLLAVTRSDLADPAPAAAEALEHLRRSSLGAVEAVAVSGATGLGLDQLRAALDRLVTPAAGAGHRLARAPVGRPRVHRAGQRHRRDRHPRRRHPAHRRQPRPGRPHRPGARPAEPRDGVRRGAGGRAGGGQPARRRAGRGAAG